MSIKNIFGKGGSYYGKGSKQLNLPSQSIDRRRKENRAYRSSNCVKCKVEGKFFVYQDGHKEPIPEKILLVLTRKSS